jgi:hypothetical protein
MLLAALAALILVLGVIALIVVLVVRACRKDNFVLPQPPPFEPQQKEQS